MGFVRFGTLPATIGAGEYIVKCPSCEIDRWADVIIISNYYHFFYVPIFPIGKEANVYCKSCAMKRYGMAFNSKLISNYEEVKKQYKHPWYTYIGVTIMALVVIGIIAAVIF